MPDPKPYTVTGRFNGNRFTYNCPTPEWALRKLRDFHQSGYEDIAAREANGAALSEADLVALVEGDPGGAPIDIDAPNAPVMLMLA